MSDNIVNFGPLEAEMSSGVWSTPANFNGFRVLAAAADWMSTILLHMAWP